MSDIKYIEPEQFEAGAIISDKIAFAKDRMNEARTLKDKRIWKDEIARLCIVRAKFWELN